MFTGLTLPFESLTHAFFSRSVLVALLFEEDSCLDKTLSAHLFGQNCCKGGLFRKTQKSVFSIGSYSSQSREGDDDDDDDDDVDDDDNRNIVYVGNAVIKYPS